MHPLASQPSTFHDICRFKQVSQHSTMLNRIHIPCPDVVFSFYNDKSSAHLCRCAKHLSPVGPAIATSGERGTHVHMVTQDVCAVAGAVHPRSMHTLCPVLTHGNVFGAAPPAITGTSHALIKTRSIPTCMAHCLASSLILRVCQSSSIQASINAEGPESGLCTCLVDQCKQLRIDAAAAATAATTATAV